MPAKYQTYPEYKDSVISWLGQVPVSWTVAKTSFFFKIAMGKTILKEDLEENGAWPVFSATEGDHYFGRVNSPNVKLNSGDIVIPARGNSIGSVKLVKEKSTTTQTTIYCQRYSSNLLFPAYVFYYLSGERKNLFRFTQTAIPQITTEEVGSNPIIIPSIEEQKQISNFLDHETAKIDTLIEKQQQLIKLLKEKRQAVISHAVTKGLNPNVPMRDSGVEWLGEVPAHWTCCSLKHKARVIDCKHITAEFFDEGIPLASISEVKEWLVNLGTAKFTNEKYYSDLIDGGRKPLSGDIIYSRNATVGEAALVSDNMPNFAMGQDVCLIRFDEGVLSEYILYVLKSGVISQQLDLAMVGSTFKRINVDDIRNFSIALPPYDKQADIVNELKRVAGKYDDLILKAVATIELMSERRSALISAAVTGKIDVRHHSSRPADDLQSSNSAIRKLGVRYFLENSCQQV